MIVPDQIRKCVVFVGYQMADETFRLAGSGFFLGRKTDTDVAKDVFLVTARHVIEGIRNLGLNEVFVRGNLDAGGSAWARCESHEWLFHPTDPKVDVAMLRAGVPDGWDHLVVPTSMCATPEAMAANEVGLGDEVIVVGLFRHHQGSRRNIPIVRVGNLAAMNEEQVSTKSLGLIDAYLIEARSIGGLSGSPVFLNLGVVRYIGNAVKHATNGPIHMLLGLVHGHFDVASSSIDDALSDFDQALTVERVNTGIAIVVPFEKLLETLNAHAPIDG